MPSRRVKTVMTEKEEIHYWTLVHFLLFSSSTSVMTRKGERVIHPLSVAVRGLRPPAALEAQI